MEVDPVGHPKTIVGSVVGSVASMPIVIVAASFTPLCGTGFTLTKASPSN
jgi:hypothetical protein